MNYTIRAFDKAQGCLIVDYEGIGLKTVPVPLTYMGLYITGDLLRKHIETFIPAEVLERQQRLAAGITNVSEIQALVTPVEESSEPS